MLSNDWTYGLARGTMVVRFEGEPSMNRYPIVRNVRGTSKDRRATIRVRRSTWSWIAAPHAVAPTVVSEAAVAECRCPTDCIRDHENE